MSTIKVEKASPADLAQLQKIAQDTFTETFAPVNTPQNMRTYLDNNLSTARLTQQLNNQSSQFYFAVREEAVIGYLKINTGQAQTVLQDHQALEIERIYVRKAFHGEKVGQLLYEKAMAIAAELAVNYVWLGVWEKNARAIRFYSKNGFEPFDQHIFKLGDDVQTDIMMKKPLGHYTGKA